MRLATAFAVAVIESGRSCPLEAVPRLAAACRNICALRTQTGTRPRGSAALRVEEFGWSGPSDEKKTRRRSRRAVRYEEKLVFFKTIKARLHGPYKDCFRSKKEALTLKGTSIYSDFERGGEQGSFKLSFLTCSAAPAATASARRLFPVVAVLPTRRPSVRASPAGGC